MAPRKKLGKRRRSSRAKIVLSPVERLHRKLFRKMYAELKNVALVRIWMAGYRRNPVHPGSIAKKAPTVAEWSELFAACRDKRVKEIFYEGYCYGMW